MERIKVNAVKFFIVAVPIWNYKKAFNIILLERFHDLVKALLNLFLSSVNNVFDTTVLFSGTYLTIYKTVERLLSRLSLLN